MLKKSMLAVVILLVATNVWAVKTLDVSKTIHNLGSLSPFSEYRGGIVDEVCIFCHTPHGGSLDGPLWNRSLTPPPGDGTGFTHYMSATLSTYMTDPGMDTRIVKTESLLCLTCHDGTVAMGSLINISNRQGDATDIEPMMDGMFEFGTMVIGGATQDLTDDHPISFSYTDAFTSKGSGLHPVADARTSGIRFFGPESFVECSSCHDPHVNGTPTGDQDYAPFLVMPNSGSALCLACHIK